VRRPSSFQSSDIFGHLEKNRARCLTEIAAIEAELRAGSVDIHGLVLALGDWSAELRLIEMEGP
jgi:hypothetical protein